MGCVFCWFCWTMFLSLMCPYAYWDEGSTMCDGSSGWHSPFPSIKENCRNRLCLWKKSGQESVLLLEKRTKPLCNWCQLSSSSHFIYIYYVSNCPSGYFTWYFELFVFSALFVTWFATMKLIVRSQGFVMLWVPIAGVAWRRNLIGGIVLETRLTQMGPLSSCFGLRFKVFVRYLRFRQIMWSRCGYVN